MLLNEFGYIDFILLPCNHSCLKLNTELCIRVQVRDGKDLFRECFLDDRLRIEQVSPITSLGNVD